MTETLIATAFFSLFGMVILWLCLCVWVFSRLESHHPEKFEEMGKPHLTANNTPKTTGELLRFVVRGGWHPLDDRQLARIGWFMRALLAAFLTGFALFLIGLLASMLK